MWRSRIRPLGATACLALLLAGAGSVHRHLVVGGVEDSAKWADPGGNMALAQRAGFQAIVLSSVWTRGAQAPSGDELYGLKAAVDVAQRLGIQPILAVYSFSGDTPLTPQDRSAYTSYAVSLLRRIPELRYISLGNEPNSSTFWAPQFGPDGSDAAAAAYFGLLQTAYPAVKRADPEVTVIGASLAARGTDNPASARQTHSPTRFIE